MSVGHQSDFDLEQLVTWFVVGFLAPLFLRKAVDDIVHGGVQVNSVVISYSQVLKAQGDLLVEWELLIAESQVRALQFEPYVRLTEIVTEL